MRTKKQTLRRITLLYIIFFAVIAMSFVLSLNSSFSEGFHTGYNDVMRRLDNGLDKEDFHVIYNLPGKTSDMDFDIPVYSADESRLTIKARASMLDIEAIAPKGEGLEGIYYYNIFVILATFAYVAIFIIIFMILRSLRRSIRRGDMFDRSNIVRTRLTGMLLICASLLFSLTSWLESRAAAPYFEGSSLAINTAFPFNYTEIIIGILIFVMAEVFAIGYSISEEQKFTI